MTGSRSSRRACSPSASSPSSGSASPSGTRVEWILADLAVMCAGGATTTVYPSTHAADVAYIVSDSECRVVFAEDDEQVAKLKEHRSELPHLDKVVLFDGRRDGDWVIGLDDLSALGEKHLAENADAVTKAIDAIQPDQLATLIYTSGHHRQAQGRAAAPLLLDLRGCRDPGPADPRPRTTCSSCGCRWPTRSARCCSPPSSRAVSRPRSTAGWTRSSTTSPIVKPTFMGAAPRIFEKAHAPHRHDAGGRGRRRRRRSSSAAFAVGLQGRRAQARGQVGPAAAEAPARRCSTAWSSPRSATASVAGCASSSPVPRRSTATSPSGSTPPAS